MCPRANRLHSQHCMDNVTVFIGVIAGIIRMGSNTMLKYWEVLGDSHSNLLCWNKWDTVLKDGLKLVSIFFLFLSNIKYDRNNCLVNVCQVFALVIPTDCINDRWSILHVPHWFVDCCFEASRLDFGHCHLVFSGPELTLLSIKSGALRKRQSPK